MALGGWPGGIEPATAICRLEHGRHAERGARRHRPERHRHQLQADRGRSVRPDRPIKVEIARGDSTNAPYAGGAGGSKTLYTVGLAVQKAAEDARQQVLAIAVEELEAGSTTWRSSTAWSGSRACPSKQMTLERDRRADAWGRRATSRSTAAARRRNTNQSPALRCPRHRVWPWTRTPARSRSWTTSRVQDVGFAINPAEVEGQIVGGMVQGIGQALYERMAYDETGQITTQSFLDYAIPLGRPCAADRGDPGRGRVRVRPVRRERRRRAAADPVHAGHRQRHRRRDRRPPH